MSLLTDLPPGLDGLQQLQALLAGGRQPPIHDSLDMALVSVAKGSAVVEAQPGARFLNPAGIVQGGYVSAIMDSACGCALHSALPPDTAFSTIELKVIFHRPVTSDTGRLRAEGAVLAVGRRTGASEARLYDDDGRLIASATSSLLLTPIPKPSGA